MTGFTGLPAHAGPSRASTSCSATLGTLFSPGLTLTEKPQTVKAKGKFADCVGGGVSRAMVKANLSGTASCTSGSISGRAQVTWDTGDMSLVRTAVDLGTGAVTGTVTAGLFAGEAVSGSLTLQPITGNCVTSPVTRAKATGSISL